MELFIEIYGVKVKTNTQNVSLHEMIQKYYKPFLLSAYQNSVDIEINLDRRGYFSKRVKNKGLRETYATIGDSIRINREQGKYIFRDQEISGELTFMEGGVSVKGTLQPHPIKHIIHTVLQGPTRIDKFYNRFLIKTCIHDIIFVHLEKKLNTCLLHATAVSNGEKTFLFTGLGGSGKSTLASAFAKIHGYTILSDNYAIVSENKLYPFPELPRITKGTQELLGINLHQKADGIKNYLSNDTTDIENSYTIDGVFICSYAEEFSLHPLQSSQDIFELLYSINNYTKEFPEYLNLSMLSIIGKFNTNNQRIQNLKNIAKDNNFYYLQNNKNLKENLKQIFNV